MSPADLYLHVFQPALQEIGALWQANEISVADEHIATAITQAAMAALFDEIADQPGREGPLLVAACADVEMHEIGLRMVCDLLELEGWRTIYLGARVSVGDLVEVVDRERPEVVALSAAISLHLPRMRAMIDGVRALRPEAVPLIVAGGRPFVERPALSAEVGADLTAADAGEAVRILAERFRA
jgi:MerR family transcriptional regulator, light-induced transcriptional regulator